MWRSPLARDNELDELVGRTVAWHPCGCSWRNSTTAISVALAFSTIYFLLADLRQKTPLPITEQARYKNGLRCFTTADELKAAIDGYWQDSRNKSSTVATLYGYPMATWCVDYIDNFDDLFSVDRNPALVDFDLPLAGWNTSSVRTMSRTFRGLRFFNQDLNFDAGKVQSMVGTFGFCERFNGDIRGWDVSRVEDFTAMFFQARSFRRNLSYWNVSSAKTLLSMFRNAAAYQTSLCPWGPQLAAATETRGMFFGTACPEVQSPDLTATTRGPFCYACE